MAVNTCPLVSIVTPVYNGSEYLEELIQSVLNQNYPNIEHIIIDDGSQDNGATTSILRKHSHLRWWSQDKKGQYATMNDGIAVAQGEFICFVSADDIISPGAISTAMNFVAEHKYLDGLFGLTSFMDAERSVLPSSLPFPRASIHFYAYFAHIAHCSFYIRRTSLGHHNLYFDSSLKYTGDYDWIIRISKSHLNIGTIDRELSRVRVHQNQTTQMQTAACKAERYKVLEKHGLNTLSYFLLSALYLFLVRLLKAVLIYKNAGIAGIYKRLSTWYTNK